MKNLSLKSKILAAAFAIGGLTAGATEVAQSMSNANQQQYEWQRYDKVTQQPIGAPFTDSEAGVRADYGCYDGTSLVCATGTAPDLSTITIYYSN